MPDTPAPTSSRYGDRDATFHAAGGEVGIGKLVDSFYDIMSSKPEYARIYNWHPDGATARDKLARFLCGWMGGPRRYHEKFGSISIPKVHAHLAVTSVERDMWVNCMGEALSQQPYPDALKRYLLKELSVPANHVQRACESAADGSNQTHTDCQ